ncbi:MAG: ROK family protein [Propionibacteriaceae bacterium]|nr:ROK family protein [Propionibacteriaceae bacterium]
MAEGILIGVEIGGTKLQVALGTREGDLLQVVRGRVHAGRGRDGILDWIAGHVAGFLSGRSPTSEGIRAIGVGFGGPVDGSGRVIKSVQIPDWDGFALKRWFEERFAIPTFVYNDSSAAGFGEFKLGTGEGTSQFFYTNIGSGIGGSLVLDGDLFDGQGVGAAELGQTRIPDWTSSVPGADIKLEALCSGWAIEARLRSPGYVPMGSRLIELARGRVEQINCRMLADAVARGDAFALAELDAVATGMGIALANVLCLFQPERIAVGGGVSLIGAPLLSRIRKRTREREFISNHQRYEILPCRLGENIVLHGAVILAARDLAD